MCRNRVTILVFISLQPAGFVVCCEDVSHNEYGCVADVDVGEIEIRQLTRPARV